MGLKKRLEHLLKHNRFVQTIYRYTMSGVFKFIGLFVRMDKKLVLMNGHGFRYNDSPRAIFEKMTELGMLEDYRVVWALKEPDKYDIPNAKKIKMDTFKYFITALKAKYWISCVNIERALHFKKKKTVYLNTWHGALINLCGNAVEGRRDFHWDYVNHFCICSDFEKNYVMRDFGVKESALLATGYPRNDDLYLATEKTKNDFREKFNIPEGKKIILYAPTWRETTDGGSSYKLAPPIDLNKWRKELQDDYVVFLRTHPYTTKLMNVQFDDFVRDYTNYPVVNDLLIAADVLISDYSSISLDYCILCKPMICFGYDYEEYSKSRGFYYDMEKAMPNGVIKSEDEVIDCLKNINYTEQCEKTRHFRDEHMQYGGNAAVACINAVFDKKF